MGKVLTDFIIHDIFSERPSSGTVGKAGRIFIASDTGAWYYDNGTTWDDITPVATGGSGPSPRIQALAQNGMSLAAATPTNMIFDTLEGDSELTDAFDQSDPEHIIVTVDAAGAWELQAFATVNCTGGGAIGSIVAVIIYVNGSAIARSSRAMDGNTSTELVTFPRRIVLEDGDDILVTVQQSSSGSVDLHSSPTDAWSGITLQLVG